MTISDTTLLILCCAPFAKLLRIAVVSYKHGSGQFSPSNRAPCVWINSQHVDPVFYGEAGLQPDVDQCDTVHRFPAAPSQPHPEKSRRVEGSLYGVTRVCMCVCVGVGCSHVAVVSLQKQFSVCV